jgi:uncharacterized membrane protein YhhN
MAVAAILAVLDWAAIAAGSRLLERCFKPGVLLALLAAALTARPVHSGVHGWLVLALALGLLGDVALSFAPPGPPIDRAEPRAAGAPSSEAPTAVPLAEFFGTDAGELVGTARPALEAADRPAPAGGAHRAPRPDASGPSTLFTAGLASFLLGHLCYCAAMLRYGNEQLSLGFGLVLVLLALLAFGHRVLAGAQAQGGTALTVSVAAYITALGSAVVLGVGTSSLWVAYGIVLFAFSDLVLASDRFVARRGWAPLTVAISYHLAQSLLLLGLVH